MDNLLNVLNYLDYMDLKNYCITSKKSCNEILKALLNRRGYHTDTNVVKALDDFYHALFQFIYLIYPSEYADHFYHNMVKHVASKYVYLLLQLIEDSLYDMDELYDKPIYVSADELATDYKSEDEIENIMLDMDFPVLPISVVEYLRPFILQLSQSDLVKQYHLTQKIYRQANKEERCRMKELMGGLDADVYITTIELLNDVLFI